MSHEVYQQAIKDLAGREAGRLVAPTASARLDNPLCGDRIDLDVTVADGTVTGLGQVTRGCLLCKASATVAVEQATGLEVARAVALVEDVRAMLRQGASPPLAGLAAFEAVRPYKSRHECVLLPFKALAKALGSGLP
ncbi:iron-sulfur cluster assembly scaffold protein [Paramagnetospirillum marisnigri]|uniref:Iron-sulfur cluster assembly scaffold protein n=1 Tax=Paramagnetospirillum marisnigri TaxID=1285242 RepID=A0A178M9B4_9PROT|nr:iron-sulfur cluster assembly scaffold protein [Paramagnetospirillum marisnigri]OAN44807.1 iron-sulfur cluster assembly scaffold protein [Paramagnetospirillum marisnigri]